jgi:very-short-patch-repair endonuclease
MTKAEACLWKYALRAEMMKGYTFNRQRTVLNFIVDFACKKLKLIIEVDGYTHLFEETIKKDKIKQDALEGAGFIVLRFTDDEVLKNINQVRQNIWDKVEELEATLPLPLGEGDSLRNNTSHFFPTTNSIISSFFQ